MPLHNARFSRTLFLGFGSCAAAGDPSNSKMRIGATPLMLSAKYASVDMIRVLVAAGADLRASTKDGTTPLLAAANALRTLMAQKVAPAMGITVGFNSMDGDGL